MPWTIKKRGEEFCVYKQDSDGDPTGEALGCHDTRGEAEGQIAALEANVEEMVKRSYVVAEFRGDFPAVETAPSVDQEALFTGDDDPFFVTLPVARVGEVSANGLLYDEELVGEIQDQMLGKGGILGHIKKEERDSAFPIEDVDWVGSLFDGDTLWGKAYIPPGEVREFVRRLKARGGKLATSIYGPYAKHEVLDDGSYKLHGLRLETLDLAPADRAALKLGGKFVVTAQMETETEEGEHDQEDEMDRDQIIAELTAADLPDTLREQVIADYEAEAENEDRIAELQRERDEAQERLAELEKEREQHLVREFNVAVDDAVAEIVDWSVEGEKAEQKVKMLKGQLKARILSEMGDDKDMERVSEVAQAAWEEEDMKLLAETVRDALTGGSAMVPGSGEENWRDELAENVKDLRKKRGI
jgi:hypothetical protein